MREDNLKSIVSFLPWRISLKLVLRGTKECPMRRILETDSTSFPYNISLKLVLRATRECLIRRILEIDSKCFL